jgi:eukaryotic-like serine/threonine-protein kinase
MGAQTHSGFSLPADVALPDRYRIERRVARGGMASVWCAHDAVLGRRVAIKLLAEQFVHDERAVRRFEREARAAARLSSHVNVVTIYDVGKTEPLGRESLGRPFIVMEYVPGGTVGDAIRVGAVPRQRAVRWIVEAAAALDYAHEHGVVHRDIKPGNLLLDGGRVLHVADFGIARIGTEDTITTTGQLFGTAAYISPEQALGRPATEASDRYALAVVAFELLVGRRPFTAEQFAVRARQHIEQEPPPASESNQQLPASIDPILARGMAKQPEERWPTAGEFAAAIEAALRDRPHAVTRPLPPRRPRPQTAAAPPPLSLIPGGARPAGGPRPRAIALAALATVAFGVGAAIATTTGGSPQPAREAAQQRAPAAAHRRAATHPARPRTPAKRPAPAPTTTVQQTTTAAPAPTTVQQTTTPAPAPTTAPPTAGSLEARGHQLMVDGEYPQAIGVLHQTLGAAAPGSLTYAYALYDLGRSLRLSGDPRDAAVVLQRRLQIPNQTSVVRQELELALRALAAQANQSGGAAATQPHARVRRRPPDHGIRASGGAAR